MSSAELESAIRDAESALDGIVAQAEKFAGERFGGGIFESGKCWNDACGKRIREMLVSSVEQVVGDHLNIYDCQSEFGKISDDIPPIIEVIEAAKKELQ